jgi:hypothetical protein
MQCRNGSKQDMFSKQIDQVYEDNVWRETEFVGMIFHRDNEIDESVG